MAEESNDVEIEVDTEVVSLLSEGDHLGKDRPLEAIRVFERISTEFGTSDDPQIRWCVAKAQNLRALALSRLGRHEEEVDCYDDVISKFSDDKDPRIRYRVEVCLFNKGKTLLHELQSPTDALECFLGVRDRYSFDPGPESQNLVLWSMALTARCLNMLARHEDALAECNLVVDAVDDRLDLEAKPILVHTLITKGLCFLRTQKPELAIEMFDQAYELDCANLSALAQEKCAWALFHKGCALEDLGDASGALRALERLVSDFGDRTDERFGTVIAQSHFRSSLILSNNGHLEESIDAVDKIRALFSEQPPLQLRPLLAQAELNRGISLHKLGRDAAALDAYDDLSDRFAHSNDPLIQQRVLWAAHNKARILSSNGSFEEAVQVCSLALEEVATKTPAANLLEPLANTVWLKADLLDRLGFFDEAIRATEALPPLWALPEYPDAVRRRTVDVMENRMFCLVRAQEWESSLQLSGSIRQDFGGYGDLQSRRLVQIALSTESFVLIREGKSPPDKCLESLDAIVAHYDLEPDSALMLQTAQALFNKAVTLESLGRADEAVNVFDENTRRFKDADGERVHRLVVEGMINTTKILEESGRFDEAVSACWRLLDLRRWPDNPTKILLAGVVYNTAVALEKKGNRVSDALDLANALVRLFQGETDKDLRVVVARSLMLKGNCELLRIAPTSDGRVRIRPLIKEIITSRRQLLARARRSYKRVFDLFWDDRRPEVRACVAEALIRIGTSLSTEEDFESSVRTYQWVVDWFASDEDPGVRLQVGLALEMKGRTLARDLHRLEEADQNYEAGIKVCSTPPDPQLKRQAQVLAHLKEAVQPLYGGRQ